MADKEDFTFQDEESFLVSDAPADQVAKQGPFLQKASEDATPPVKKTSPLRILLLVLLLVVLGGAAFYYFMGVPAPEPPAPLVVQKKPISVPPPAPPAPAPQPAATPVAVKPETPKPAVVVAPAQPEAPVPPAVAKSTAPAVKPAGRPAVKPSAVKPSAVPPAATVARGGFTLHAGAYLLPSSLASVEKTVRKLGYAPVTTPVRHKVAMTRLKIGTYPPAEAKAKLADLLKVAPDAFMLTHNGQATVYAGSYLILDEARNYADRLFAQGIRVEEEPAQVRETLQSISFGAFADRQAAQTAAAQAKAAGLDAMVVKRR